MKKSLLIALILLIVTTINCLGQTWPRFRNTSDLVGFADSPGPSTDQLLWEFYIENLSSIVSSPAVVNDKVYFGALDSLVYCLNSNTGVVVWTYKTTGPIYYSSPAVNDGKVYIGSWDGFMYCLDADDGTLQWSFNTGITSGFNSCPSVVNGKVYFGSNNSKIYCLDAETGEVIWSYLTGMSVWCSPSIVDNRLYIGSFDSKMRCLDAETGDSIWATNVPAVIYSSPAVVNDKLYFGSIVGGTAYCLSTADGSILWQRALNGAIFSSPAVRNGRVFIGVDQLALGGGSMYCLDAQTGDSLWSIFHDNSGSVYASPAVNDSLLFYGTLNFRTYCVRQTTGEIVWDYLNFDQVLSSPALVNDRLYYGTKDGQLVCLSSPVKTNDITLTKESFNIYPNPSDGQLNIALKLQSSSFVTVKIFSALGTQALITKSVKMDKGDNVLNLNPESKLAPGIYLCAITFNNETHTRKVMIR